MSARQCDSSSQLLAPLFDPADAPGPGARVVVSLSGGLDSATCLAWARSRGAECHTLSFDYGQRHAAELQAARALSRLHAAATHRVLTIDGSAFSGSALTDADVSVPDSGTTAADTIPVTYVPARNTVFLALALALAESLDAGWIVIGANAVDYSGYPDCRPAFIERFQALAAVATRAVDGQGRPVRLAAPLIHLSKAEIITLGMRLGVAYDQTVSCYRATSDGRACGRCDSCALRRQGFEAAGVADPTRYVAVPGSGRAAGD